MKGLFAGMKKGLVTWRAALSARAPVLRADLSGRLRWQAQVCDWNPPLLRVNGDESPSQRDEKAFFQPRFLLDLVSVIRIDFEHRSVAPQPSASPINQ